MFCCLWHWKDCVQDIMKPEEYQNILVCDAGLSVRKLCLYQRSWVFQQDNNPKHASKSAQERLETKCCQQRVRIQI